MSESPSGRNFAAVEVRPRITSASISQRMRFEAWMLRLYRAFSSNRLYG